MQLREGWYVGFGAALGAAAAILGLLVLVGVAPNTPVIDGSAIVILGIARLVP
jgi:hypothetical protein